MVPLVAFLFQTNHMVPLYFLMALTIIVSHLNALTGNTHSHDETQDIAPIISAALLFNGPKLRVDRDAYKEPHKWVFSQIAPLQGKIVFEKVSCPRRTAEQEFVRIRANGALLDISKWCPTELSTYGLCPLKKFAEQLDFANTDQEWNTCFT